MRKRGQLSPKRKEYQARITSLAEHMVPSSQDALFDASARTLIMGLIDYAVRSDLPLGEPQNPEIKPVRKRTKRLT